MVKRLHQIVNASKGPVELDVIGQTNFGKDIYLAKAGDPANTSVMIMTRQHGDEPMPTEAALKLLKKCPFPRKVSVFKESCQNQCCNY